MKDNLHYIIMVVVILGLVSVCQFFDYGFGMFWPVVALICIALILK